MINKTLFTLAVALFFVSAPPAQATTIQIGSSALLGANDFFDWGQVRVLDGSGNAQAVASPQTVTSNLGRSANISDGGTFTGLIEGTDWAGNFLAGENLLYSGDANDPFTAAATAFTVDFTTAVRGLGLQIMSAAYFDFSASLELFNGSTSLGLFSVSGTASGAEDGSAPFLGALSDSSNITSAVFTLTSSDDLTLGFAVNRLLTADSPGTPPVDPGPAVPEPGTLSLVALGIGGALARRRRPLS